MVVLSLPCYLLFLSLMLLTCGCLPWYSLTNMCVTKVTRYRMLVNVCTVDRMALLILPVFTMLGVKVKGF